MQSQEFSEEYYKMKYFKYRAKYEQLKEIAEARGLQQGGVQQVQVPVAVPQLTPEQIEAFKKQMEQDKPKSTMQKMKDMYANSQAKREATNEGKKANASELMEKIHVFVLDNLKTKNERKYKKIVGKLERPCSYKQLIDIVSSITQNNDEAIDTNKHKTYQDIIAHVTTFENTKKNLIADIKTQCSTVTGGINEICKYTDKEDQDYKSPEDQTAQEKRINGGYTDSPNSLDNMSEF
jgi:hypothetical protein